jgi:peptidoglycan-associated lipoprotein
VRRQRPRVAPVRAGREASFATIRSVPRRPSLGPVYFDYDRFNIRDDAKAALASNAKAIKDNAGWGVVTIEGHCDERGSEEYNIALGELRARAVKQYLSDLGVSSGRLDVVSFGEAKPAVMGHDESAWRYNRRSEFSGGR